MKSKKPGVKKLIVIAAIVVLLLIFCIYQNTHLVSTEYVYKCEKITSDMNGYKIVQISDLHNATFGIGNKPLIEMVNNANPDIIVITGDVVDSNHTNIKKAIDTVQKLAEICPTYYVTGNHEFWLSDTEQDELFSGLEKAGVIILNNEAVTINDSFTLIGLSDKNLSDNTLNNISSEINETTMKVLLAHEPEFYENYSNSDMDLVLSGHNHGGQFILPFLGPVVDASFNFFPDLTSGVHIFDDTTMIISRGLGNSVVPVRLFNYPEVVIITLEA